MTLYEADLQLAVARHLRWMPDRITLDADSLLMEGWALGVWDAQTQCRFLVNGVDFDVLEWPLPSPDLLTVFPDVPQAAHSRFRCRHYLTDGGLSFPGGWARFNVTGPAGEHAWSYRTAWFLADPAQELPLPPAEQIAQVIGTPDPQAFCLGGATMVARFAHLLSERFNRPLSSFTAILDWGCGVGRLTRYLVGQGPAVTGMGSQPAHMQYCRTALPAAHFVAMGDTLASGQFDLVLGLSMLPHLSEAEQDSWLAELQRLTRPGALLLLSVQGLTHMALYRTPMVHKLEAHRTGWHDMAGHAGLDSPTPSGPDVLHAPDYILAHWGRYFDVLDMVEAMAGHQDGVGLRRRAD